MERLHLELSASIEELERMGAAVMAFCTANAIDSKLAYTLRLVCDEWVTNIIVHGYGGAAPSREAAAIEVQLSRVDEGTLRLAFIDHAPPFNPLLRPAPDVSLPVEERDLGGLGIHFIRNKMDECVYERVASTNQLVLLKKLGGNREESYR